MQVCSDCATPATFVHREYATVNYACDRHRCYHCTPIKNDDGSGSENIVRACAWDSPTAFRYCYTHQSWVHKPIKLCPVAIEITELRELVGRVQEAMSDISDQFEDWAEDRNNTDGRDLLVGNKKDFKIAEWQNQ